MFLRTRMATIGIETIKARIPSPGTQGPPGDALSNRKIAAMATI
jgi:hypothetical protein